MSRCAGIPCVVTAQSEEDGSEAYTVLILREPGQSGSFVTEKIRQGHGLYYFFRTQVGILNMVGDLDGIASVGENLTEKNYNVYISDVQHAFLCDSKTARET